MSARVMDPETGLARAMRTMAPPPCEVFACARRQACAGGLACQAFAVYVETGQALAPISRVVTTQHGHLKVQGADGQPMPTPAIFARLFSKVSSVAEPVPSGADE